MSLVAPRCAAELQDQRENLRGIDCRSIEIISSRDSDVGFWAEYMPHSNVVRDVKGTPKNWLIQRLCEGKPLGISVCTDFMFKPGTVNTKNCSEREMGTDGRPVYGRHAMAVVGHRVLKNGETQLLVQNSWGATCNYPNEIIKNGCEKDETGKFTGRFWISSDLLINNTNGVHSIAP